MKIVIVNEKDEVIGSKERKEVSTSDISRVTGLWVFNGKGEVLVAQRSLLKVHGPGKWALSVAGTVEEGETYEMNALKEVREELGLIVKEGDLISGPHKFVNGEHPYFCQVYFIQSDISAEDFVIQKSEVEQVKWVSVRDLLDWYKERPEDFNVSFSLSLEDVLGFLGKELV
jgi:isopentenyl-diphosphate delta-isomerase